MGRPKGTIGAGFVGAFELPVGGASDFLLAFIILGPAGLLRRLFTTGATSAFVTDGGGGTVSGAGGALPFRLRDLTLFALIVSESELDELSLRDFERAGRSTSTKRSGGPSDFSASELSASAPTPVETPSNHLRILLRLSPQFLQFDSVGGCCGTG